MMKWSGLDHDSSDHLAPSNQSKRSNKSPRHSYPIVYIHVDTHISCGVVEKRGKNLSEKERAIFLRRCLPLLLYLLRIPFSLFFLYRKLNNELISGELEIPARCHHRQIVLGKREKKKVKRREKLERLEAFVSRRERAIRSRQSFGHQHKRRDVTHIIT